MLTYAQTHPPTHAHALCVSHARHRYQKHLFLSLAHKHSHAHARIHTVIISLSLSMHTYRYQKSLSRSRSRSLSRSPTPTTTPTFAVRNGYWFIHRLRQQPSSPPSTLYSPPLPSICEFLQRENRLSEFSLVSMYRLFIIWTFKNFPATSRAYHAGSFLNSCVCIIYG
jgi:hypothetical protein